MLQYQRFLRVLEKWPTDKSKLKRDLGEEIREYIKLLANPSGLTSQESHKVAHQIDSLERISKNIYTAQYPRRFTSTATGLTAEQCTQVLSSEFLHYLNDNSNSKKDED